MSEEKMQRVRDAFAGYKAAQRRQAHVVCALNSFGAETQALAEDAISGDAATLVKVLRQRSKTLNAESAFDGAGSIVFMAAASLVEALEDAGFGDPAPAEGGAA